MKNEKILFGGFATLLIYLLSSCISDYEAVIEDDMAGLLVVEGVILEEGTKITLSRTVHLSEAIFSGSSFDNINNATIHIIDEGYNIIAVATQENSLGPYTVNERFSFVPEMKYALDIHLYNKHYQSAFVDPVSSPEIDEVSWKINNDHSIDIMVSTHDPNNETLYCLWSFEENWELTARYLAPYRYDPITETVIQQNLTDNNRYYCWDSGYSHSLLLATSEKNWEAVVKDHRIHTLQPKSSRYSYLYCISVNQYRLNREASIYFNNLQKNIDESSSLFAPQPSEITGNIRCLSEPDENVIGYIFAAKPATYRLFIPMADLGFTAFESRPVCDDERTFPDPKSAYDFGYAIYTFSFSSGYQYISRQCVDCTQIGGTKSKPDFWPNNHQ